MKTRQKPNLLKDSMYPLIIQLSLPIMLNSLIQTLYNLVDGIWVSKLGSVAFAATSFVWPINFLFISIGNGIAIAGTSLLSQHLGAGRKEEADTYASQLVALAAIVGVFLCAVGLIVSPFVIWAMGARGELAQYSNLYLRITLLDMPFMFIYAIFNAMMQSEGNTVTPTVFAGVSALLNMILDPLFIFTFGLGVVGAAYATLLSKGLLAIIAIYFMFSGKTYVKPNFKNFKFDLHILKRCMKIGLPSSIGQSGSAIGFMVLNFFVTSYGTATLAAFGMVNRITSLVSQPAMGIGAALVAIVGQNIGANQMKRVKEAFWKSFILAFSLGAIGCIILLWKDTEIIHFFIRSTDDDEVIRQSIHFLGYLAYSMPLMGIFSVYTGIFQGSSHTKYAMAMEIGRLWAIRLPMILLFKHFTTIGETGIWFSMSFSNLIICIYAMTIYVRGKWAMQK